MIHFMVGDHPHWLDLGIRLAVIAVILTVIGTALRRATRDERE